MVLQKIVRFFVPQETHFYDYLEHQAAVAFDGASALANGFRSGAPLSKVHEDVQSHEHEGDKIYHQMEEALARTFVTPIDREDIQRLSSELDDILDRTNEAARACKLYGVPKPSEAMMAMVDVLVRATALLKSELPKLRQHAYGDLITVSRNLRTIEKEGDKVFRDAMRDLFADPNIDAKVLLRDKEILETLEEAVDDCEQVADTLANLAVKHG